MFHTVGNDPVGECTVELEWDPPNFFVEDVSLLMHCDDF